jgi:transposase-like protein
MQYLIKTISHDTGEVFHDVVRARENEVFMLVDAESEDEAREKAINKIQCPVCGSFNTEYDYLVDAETKRNLGIGFKCNECKSYGIY